MNKPSEKKEKLKIIIDKLLEYGEDKDELMMWYELFDALDDRTQNGLIHNLEQELEALQA